MKKNIICPNCGAKIEIEKANGLKCPFCSGSLAEKFGEDNGFSWIAPFKEDKLKIENEVRKRLVQISGIHSDVINSLSFEVEKAFIPLFEIHVTYKISHSKEKTYSLLTSASSKFHIFKKRYNYMYEEDWEDFFNDDDLDDDDLDDDDLDDDDLDDDDLDDDDERQSKEKIDLDAKIYARDIKERVVLKSEEVKDYLSFASSDALVSVPEWTSYNFALQEGNDRNKPIAIPGLAAVWIFRYKYEGESYEFIINGSNGEVLNETYPRTYNDNNDDLEQPISLTTFGWITFIFLWVGVFFVYYSSINNITSGLIMGIVFALSSFILYAWMFFKQYNEKESYNEIIHNREWKDGDTSSVYHNKKVLKDKNLMRLFYVILFFQLGLL